MHVKAVTLNLPNPHYVLSLHEHTSEDRCHWRRQDRDRLDETLEIVSDIYDRRVDINTLRLSEREGLYNAALTKEEALGKIIPHYADIDRLVKSEKIIDHAINDIQITAIAGRDDEEYGYYHCTLVRGEGRLWPTEKLFDHLAKLFKTTLQLVSDTGKHSLSEYAPGDPTKRLIDQDGNPFDIDSLEVRSSLRLAQLVRNRPNDELVLSGTLRVVMVPNDADFYLSRNKGGEVIKESAREWS